VSAATRPVVLKFGGELLEDRSHLAAVISAIGNIVAKPTPLVVVHGGGKEIDAALKAAGVQKQQVDGLRITNDATLGVVVSVLGAVNTRLVAGLTTAGVAAVGLTGADAGCGLSDLAPPHRAVDGRLINLGKVGVPSVRSDTRLLTTLLRNGFVPVVACIGVGSDGQLLNVNADTLAGHLAVRLGARRLVVAGTTAGVLGSDGKTAPLLDGVAIAELVNDRTATAGMVAKLKACERALAGGVDEVMIVDGRDGSALEAAAAGSAPPNATRLGLKHLVS
jgi:acetylglutamate kinase